MKHKRFTQVISVGSDQSLLFGSISNSTGRLRRWGRSTRLVSFPYSTTANDDATGDPRWQYARYTSRAKFGDPFHCRTVKGHQRAIQIAERRRRYAEARNADELDRLEWAFRPWPVKVLATTLMDWFRHFTRWRGCGSGHQPKRVVGADCCSSSSALSFFTLPTALYTFRGHLVGVEW